MVLGLWVLLSWLGSWRCGDAAGDIILLGADMPCTLYTDSEVLTKSGNMVGLGEE